MEFTIKFKPGLSQLKKIKHLAEEELKLWNLPYLDMMDILLAIDESITNIITHGYDRVSATDFIELEIESDDHTITIQITDNGRKFDFDATPAPDIRKNLTGKKKGGFGVHLIKSVMDDAKFTRTHNKNILILKKSIKVLP